MQHVLFWTSITGGCVKDGFEMGTTEAETMGFHQGEGKKMEESRESRGEIPS